MAKYIFNVVPTEILLVGHGHHISEVHFNDTSTEILRTDTTGTVVGIDYHYS